MMENITLLSALKKTHFTKAELEYISKVNHMTINIWNSPQYLVTVGDKLNEVKRNTKILISFTKKCDILLELF